jgi:hypothetical protein
LTLTPGTLTATTSSTGQYAFANVPAGTYTLTVSAVAQGLNTASVPVTLAAGGSKTQNFTLTAVPSSGVRADLAAIATALGAMPNSPQARHALKALSKLNDPKLWVNNNTLTPQGKKVFDQIANAAGQLGGKGKHGKGGAPSTAATNPQLAAFLPRLANDAQQLATTQIGLSTTAGGDPKELAKANEEKAKALAALASGDFKKAIQGFGKAWDHAEHAIKKKHGNGGGNNGNGNGNGGGNGNGNGGGVALATTPGHKTLKLS